MNTLYKVETLVFKGSASDGWFNASQQILKACQQKNRDLGIFYFFSWQCNQIKGKKKEKGNI